jgi:hypothetical protein
MTLDERLQLAFPNGAPADVAAFLRGEWVKNMQGVHLSIKAQADEARREHSGLLDQSQALRRGLGGRRNELAFAQAELTVNRLCHFPTDGLVAAVTKSNVLEWVVERLENDLDLVEEQYRFSLNSGRLENWTAITELSTVRIKDEMLTPTLAAKFESTPEEMTQPARWARYLKLEQERAEYEEQRKREREERERLANAESYVRTPTGCEVCDHEKCAEISAVIHEGVDVGALAQKYGIRPSAITDHWSGHLNLKGTIPLPKPAAASV